MTKLAIKRLAFCNHDPGGSLCRDKEVELEGPSNIRPDGTRPADISGIISGSRTPVGDKGSFRANKQPSKGARGRAAWTTKPEGMGVRLLLVGKPDRWGKSYACRATLSSNNGTYCDIMHR